MKLITREGKTKLIGVVRAVGQIGPLNGGSQMVTNDPGNVPQPATAAQTNYPAPALGVK